MEEEQGIQKLEKSAKLCRRLEPKTELTFLNQRALELSQFMQGMDWPSYVVLVEVYDIKQPVEILERLTQIITWRQATNSS